MKFTPPLIQGRLKRRYKRFLADVELEHGELVVAHCPNTGSMTNCLVENGVCWLSRSDNPKRKLAYTLEAVTAKYGGMAGINTGMANKLVYEALELGRIKELSLYGKIEKEVSFGQEKSRLDFRLSGSDCDANDRRSGCYVEVKNLTLGMENRLGMFPDAVTTRGAKHLRELARAKQQGNRAVLLFCVQHQGIDRVTPAREIDPDYYQALMEAKDQGVEVLAYKASLSPNEFVLEESVPFSMNKP